MNTNLGHDSSRSVEWLDERADILRFIYEELGDKPSYIDQYNRQFLAKFFEVNL